LPQSNPKGFSFHNKVDTTPTPIEALDKGKGIASEQSKKLEEKKSLNCHGYGNFQADFSNWRTLIIREVKEV